jgi:hypothetical protein
MISLLSSHLYAAIGLLSFPKWLMSGFWAKLSLEKDVRFALYKARD